VAACDKRKHVIVWTDTYGRQIDAFDEPINYRIVAFVSFSPVSAVVK